MLLSRQTSITTSGQMTAHIAQPVQLVLFTWAGKKPFLLECLEMTIQPFGHTTAQSPQPLHISVLIVILPVIFVLRISYRILTGPEEFVK